jgi:hypothetical protein
MPPASFFLFSEYVLTYVHTYDIIIIRKEVRSMGKKKNHRKRRFLDIFENILAGTVSGVLTWIIIELLKK